MVTTGVIIVIGSILGQAIYLSYIGLGIIFWGIILGLIITKIPSAPEEVTTIKNPEDLEDQSPRENEENSDITQNEKLRLENAAQQIQEPCIVQEGKQKEPVLNEPMKYILLKTIGESQSIDLERQMKSPQNSNFNVVEKNSQRIDDLQNKEMLTLQKDALSKDKAEEINQSTQLILPDHYYYPDKDKDKKIDEALLALEQSRQNYENYREPKKIEKINPKLKQYTEEVTKCPLRRPDKQDCFFCDAKNCQDRKLLERK